MQPIIILHQENFKNILYKKNITKKFGYFEANLNLEWNEVLLGKDRQKNLNIVNNYIKKYFKELKFKIVYNCQDILTIFNSLENRFNFDWSVTDRDLYWLKDKYQDDIYIIIFH